MEGLDGGFSGIMLAGGWNVPGGLYSRLFSMLFSICKPDILRMTSGKLLRVFFLLVEGNGIQTAQKRVLSGGQSKEQCLAALTLGSVCLNRLCF